MAKPKLSAASKKWFGGPSAKHPAQPSDEKMKVTLYVSKAAWRALWYRRAETGVPLSRTFEELVLKHLDSPTTPRNT